MILNQEEIKNLLPHRKPFLFLDSVEILEIGIKGIGYKTFQKEEYFFEGHFPQMPIVPGVILVEALAQTAGIVVSYSFSKQSDKSNMKGSIESPITMSAISTERVVSIFFKCALLTS